MHIEILNKTKSLQTVIIHLKAGEEVPLHDHPNTHVFLYVVNGQLQMDCFDRVKQAADKIWITPTLSKIFKNTDNILLTPDVNNLHHITAITDTSFMDVVTPGYFESCNEPSWYEICNQKSDIIEVQPISQPDNLVKAKAAALEIFEKMGKFSLQP